MFVQDVDDLPDYKKVSFPLMPPVDLSLLIPHADSRDVSFLHSLLQLNPKRRSTAEQARDDPYFNAFPPPCPLSELPVPSRSNSSSSSSGSHSHVLKKDENIADYLSSFIV